MIMSSGATVVDSSSSENIIATMAAMAVIAVAIASNLAVLIVVVRSPALRAKLTNVFVINLCVIDSLAATIVMPLMLADHTETLSHLSTARNVNRTLLDPTDTSNWVSCSVVRLLSAFVVFASVLSVSLVNVERFVSIRYPMQHAAHLTVGRTIAAIAGVWTTALAVAATPLAANWDVFDMGTRCCTRSTSTVASVVFVIVIEALLFVAPTFMIAAMYGCIYRVARQARRQVAPTIDDRNNVSSGPTLCHRPVSSINPPVSCSLVNSSSISCSALNHVRRNADVTRLPTVISEPTPSVDNHELATSLRSPVRDSPVCIVRTLCHEDCASTAAVTDHVSHTSQTAELVAEVQQSGRMLVSDKRWKAAVTLVFVLVTFLPPWSPLFAYTLYRAVERTDSDCDQAPPVDHVEVAVAWVGFVTFASNAFVYGWMNRSIRDAFRDAADRALSRCAWAQRGRDRLSQVFGAAGDAEDFFQFLERTSSFDRAQSITQSTSVELTKASSQTRS